MKSTSPQEDEMQVIDYDNVATCMNTTITELLYHNCHIISGLDGGSCTVYIHKNFISIQYETQSSDDNVKVCAAMGQKGYPHSQTFQV